MATTLGKRKRRGIEATKEDWSESVEESSSLQEHAQAIFRRHFEAKFKPLPVGKKVITSVDETSEDDYEAASDWDGISEDGESNIQIIEHIDAQSRMGAMSKEKLKLFMVCLLHNMWQMVWLNYSRAPSLLKEPQIPL